MVLVALLFLNTGLLNAKPTPVFADLYVGSEGPYRFLVDTGSQTSIIDPALAARLGLQPAYRVELITQHSKSLAPALKVNTLRIGSTRLSKTELVLRDVSEPRKYDSTVMGVLGLNALAGLDFVLSPGSGTMQIAPDRPIGEPLPFRRVEDRIAVRAQMGSEDLTLILDSGATHIVLFHTPEAMKKTPPVAATAATLDGARSTVPTTWTAKMSFHDGLKLKMQPAAIVQRPGSKADGLLPASLFKAVYVSQARSEIILIK